MVDSFFTAELADSVFSVHVYASLTAYVMDTEQQVPFPMSGIHWQPTDKQYVQTYAFLCLQIRNYGWSENRLQFILHWEPADDDEVTLNFGFTYKSIPGFR